MGYLDQIIASLSFQFKEVANFRFQNVWKSIFYVVVLVLVMGTMVSVHRMTGAASVEEELANIPEDYTISKEGAVPLEEPVLISLPQIDTLVVVGSMEAPGSATGGLQNLVVLGEENWGFGRVGFPVYEMNYTQFPFLSDDGDGMLTKVDLLELGARLDESLRFFAPLYQYARVFLDLVIHFVLISLLALAGRSFRKTVPITYKQAWVITSYGITAPIMFRTLIQLMGLTISFLPLLYWMTVTFFSIGTIRNMK